jgi:hypothetical protein
MESLLFKLKGPRTYVQGASLFNALVSFADSKGWKEGKIKASFRKMVTNPLCIIQDKHPSADDAVTAEVVNSNGESLLISINPASEQGLIVREDFDEAFLCRHAEIGDGSIFLEHGDHSDTIELLVSLCKKMHLETIDSTKKWIFSRYDGLIPLSTNGPIELRLVKQVGTRLTCSEILINGTRVADMYFS